jgi:hypothetical protein
MHTASSQTEMGLPGYKVNSEIECEAVIPLKAKLRKGVVRIRAELMVRDTGSGPVQSILPVDITKAERFTFNLTLKDPGIYRIILTGEMELSDGETQPFCSKSYPFVLL